MYPALKLYTLGTSVPSHRTLSFVGRDVVEWTADFGEVIGKAVDVLRDMVQLRKKDQRTYRVRFVKRGS